MGCGSSRKDLIQEEKAIVAMEYELHFVKHSCSYTDFILRKYNKQGFINSSHWGGVVSSLKIRDNQSVVCPNLQKFYEQLKSNDLLPLNQVLVLGILLSSGTPYNKARLLFEITDEDNAGSVSVETISGLLELMLDLSINKLPILVSDLAVPKPQVSEQDVLKYQDKLQSLLPRALPMLLGAVCGTVDKEASVSKKYFCEKFQKEEIGELTTPSGIRSWVYLRSNRLMPSIALEKSLKANSGSEEDAETAMTSKN